MAKIGDMKVIRFRHVCRFDGRYWRVVSRAPCLISVFQR